MSKENTSRYSSIDGLRAIACLGIIAMHVRANTAYEIASPLYKIIVGSWTWFVPLFLMISGFSVCAGYLKSMQEGTVDLETFYLKRYKRLLPFFSLLVLASVATQFSKEALLEGSVELTLLYGLLPNNTLDIMGIAWTIGVIFLFYLLFPWISVLLKNKRRAWCSLGISLWLVAAGFWRYWGENYVTESFTPRHSFLYCLPFFLAGGILYLYAQQIVAFCNKLNAVLLLLCIAATIVWYYVVGESQGILFYLMTLVLFLLWLAYAIGGRSAVLNLKPLRFLGRISMELYLAQMMVFRVLEKLHILYLAGKGWSGFCFAFIIEVAALIAFTLGYRWVEGKFNRLLKKEK